MLPFGAVQVGQIKTSKWAKLKHRTHMPLRQVNGPDFSLRGIDGSINEEQLPADITDLWTAYRALLTDQRRQFLQAAAKWQEALKLACDSSTLSFALMVGRDRRLASANCRTAGLVV